MLLMRPLMRFLRHFRFEILRFFYFRLGVSGVGEGAGVVVEPLGRPEVGAAYQDFRMDAVFDVGNDGAHFAELLYG